LQVVAQRRLPRILLALFVLLLAVTAWHPYDGFTWLLEVAPALLAIPLLVVTYRRFPLTDLAYVLVFLQACILAVGGHYTYARVPLGEWMKDWFHLARNDFDRIGHFAQGVIPALVTRELLRRKTPLGPGAWLATLCVCVALAVSALYELVEWGVSEASGSAGDAFLGTQGDIWDTQKDMLTAFIGAILCMLTLQGLHERQLANLASKRAAAGGLVPSETSPH
jgi:putative membrane protein